MTFVNFPWQPIVTGALAIFSGIIWIVVKITKIQSNYETIMTNHLPHIYEELREIRKLLDER